ncbi:MULTISPECIES: hypothetical protein [unclassified Streptomyces]|uniref:hypothetical protein n=1 Tax=Streptomyces TaxID=1883 RepID=UPI00131A6545|nr:MULTISPECIES: hypothetical protein [unclassified Streptomyces]
MLHLVRAAWGLTTPHRGSTKQNAHAPTQRDVPGIGALGISLPVGEIWEKVFSDTRADRAGRPWWCPTLPVIT